MGQRAVYRDKISGQYFRKVDQVATTTYEASEAQSAHFDLKIRADHLVMLGMQFPRTEWEVVEIKF